MSKNFELLRQASWSQEFFADLPTESHASEPNQQRVKRSPTGSDQISTFVRGTFLNPRGPHIQSVLLAGLSRGAACTRTCAQAAKVLADSIEGKVCVVDANFRAPALHQYFSHESQAGLSDAMIRSKPPGEFATKVNWSNLWLVTAGYQNERARSVANNAILETYLRELREQFDYLLIDSEVVDSGAGAPAGCRAVDGVVLVGESREVVPDFVLKMRKTLERARVPLLGVVLNESESGLRSFSA